MQIKGTRDSKIEMPAISSVLNKYYYCLSLRLGIFLYRMGGNNSYFHGYCEYKMRSYTYKNAKKKGRQIMSIDKNRWRNKNSCVFMVGL